jgi:hypothetical protein
LPSRKRNVCRGSGRRRRSRRRNGRLSLPSRKNVCRGNERRRRRGRLSVPKRKNVGREGVHWKRSGLPPSLKRKRAQEEKRKAESAIKEENRQKRKRMYEEMYEALGLL